MFGDTCKKLRKQHQTASWCKAFPKNSQWGMSLTGLAKMNINKSTTQNSKHSRAIQRAPSVRESKEVLFNPFSRTTHHHNSS